MEDRPFPGAWKDDAERESLRIRLRAFRFVDPETASAWTRRYGMRSLELAEFISADAALQDRLPGPRPLLLGEVHFAALREWARTPVDFYRRRTDLYFAADAGLESLAQVESVFDARAPGWRRALGPEADYREFLRRNRHVAVA
jgi:glycerol-3-phosphate dehydrogenase